ncbi:Rne/Rng family ribonuclease [Nocardioides sp.]|uniref:Rne/Rng family ribonuclease n=1 Tax=Nocardioides sp. TaxID=35761 RepID=UPI0037835FD6
MADDLQAGADQTTSAGADPADDSVAKPAKKAAAKKTAATKAAAKKTTAKKAAAKKTTTKKAAKKKAATTDVVAETAQAPAPEEPADAAPAKKASTRRSGATTSTRKKTASSRAAATTEEGASAPHGDALGEDGPAAPAVLFQTPEVTTTTRRRGQKAAEPEPTPEPIAELATEGEGPEEKKAAAKKSAAKKSAAKKTAAKKTEKKSSAKKTSKADPGSTPAEESEESEDAADEHAATEDATAPETGDETGDQTGDEAGDEAAGEGGTGRRRRRRGGRRRRKSGDGGDAATDANAEGDSAAEATDGSAAPAEDAAGGGDEGGGESTSSRRRRRRRRSGDDGAEGADDPEKTVTRVRSRRAAEDEITAVSGSTRLEAKKQRRREGREAGRRRAPIVSEAEFLARRESVDRVMVIRQREDLTQIGVLEDRVLVEHYVARESQTSLIGNVYLGRVQNVLPSMEAAFIDIGKGRNAVLYAGEVNWSALGHKDGQPRKIESVLSSGQTVLVQVTKDPIGHKGARLTSQISLAGRFLVYVPDGTTSGISRKLPDTERNRLKTLLKEIVPDTAGVIVRTAAEGASEDELTRDVERLKARWEDIESKARGNAPQLLYGEPDLTLKVVRDLFTEDFSQLVIQGDDAWDTVQAYVEHVAPDLAARLVRYEPGPDGAGGKADVFAEYRIDEQIAKGLDRKVWLPSGGSLVIDRTEAMTVVDVNTGKFTGSGGNLEETVTKNNLEAAEEIVRQLRLRDIGGIIVVDFIDMVLESNRDLVLRRLVECLGRDRTRHQVAEVTSLGLVQMTRKRIGTGLLEAFSETCEHCQGRGLVVHDHPVEPRRGDDEPRRGGAGGRRGRRGRGADSAGNSAGNSAGKEQDAPKPPPSPKDVAAMAVRPEPPADTEPPADSESPADTEPTEPDVLAEAPVTAAATESTDPAVQSETEPVTEPAAETGSQPVAPEPPQVVTRTRRRSASRPAGEPTPVTPVAVVETVPQAEPEPEVAAEPAAEPAAETAAEPAAETVAETEATPAAPEPPKVVTRTRRRSASRPAGPPVAEPDQAADLAAEPPPPPGAIGSVGSPPQDGAVEPGTAEGEPGEDHAHVEHVPVKKKGSRKR